MTQLEMNLDSSEVTKAKAKVRELAEQHRAERAAERAKPEPSSRPIPTATDPPSVLGPRGGSGSAGGDKKAIKPVYKAGGKVSSKLKSAGFYDKGKTTSERKKIISKVTTKPQRLGMVEKMFSVKKDSKVKKFQDGGMTLEEKYPGAKITRAGPQPPPVEGGKGSEQHIRNLEELRYMRGNANAKPELFEEPKSKGKSGGGGGGGSGGMTDPMERKTKPYNKAKGGVISSASKRADGIAIKGKTRA